MNKCPNNSCNNCLKLKEKIKLYENFMKELKKYEVNDSNENTLECSIIIEKDNEGFRNKKIKSNLNESFLLIESGKNLEELDNDEYQIITLQDDLLKVDNAKSLIKKAGIVYTIATYVLKLGAWLI